MTPRVVLFSGGRVWRACDPGHWGALPGLRDARFAEDVLGDRHQGEAAAAVLSACLARELGSQLQANCSSNQTRDSLGRSKGRGVQYGRWSAWEKQELAPGMGRI